ncbi:hypothetical protein TL16_g04340 [Triparma laevis f. inornata]|uniref:PIH1D1/2/3 CS-like domain-containing protein n=2 Tax=Triparma laevis TaxID=1534972 RepID=A0A9W7FAX0_9STRA|nr:hypothetical protein TL16_g04340 [Triparma laevis f. inornata]GMI08134.1 hypothetical protein TrLO_g14308 [Triparma laevis f. longispina]
MAGFGDLSALSDLLQAGDEANNEYTTVAQHAAHFGGPAPTTVVAKQPKKSEPQKDSGEIWDVDEVPDEEGIKLQQPQDAVKDTRAVCKHEIYYKQSVDSSDVYLGLSDITPGSTDCTHIVVKAHFPSHALKDIELDVTKNVLTADSDKFRLKVYLPQPVDPDEGSAKFDSKTFVLTVTLPVLEKEW